MSSAPNFSCAPRLTPLRAVFAACGVTLGWLATDLAYGILVDPHRLRLLTTYVLPVFATVVLWSVWRLARSANGSVRLVEFFAGSVFLIGAAAIDLIVTVKSDPFLSLEGNPYIRVLLDRTEHSYSFVYALVAITQVLFVAIFVTAWWAFLRHRSTIAGSLINSDATSWLGFAKAATGGGCLTYRQWLLPFRPEEIPDPYMSVWPAALAACFGTSLFRYWAAAEWLDFVPAETMLRFAALAVGVGGTLVAYYGWLALRWRAQRAEGFRAAR
jgi:hypothetical protein